MKNTKALRIIVDLLLIILGIIFLVFAIKDAKDFINSQKTNPLTDAERFSKDYSYIDSNNVYKYISLEELNNVLDNTGIIILGEKYDPWMQVLVSPLNDIISSYNKNILYYDTSIEVDETSDIYISIISKLGINNFGVFPNIIIVKDGKILLYLEKKNIYDLEYSGAPIDYWTDESIKNLKDKLKSTMDNL